MKKFLNWYTLDKMPKCSVQSALWHLTEHPVKIVLHCPRFGPEPIRPGSRPHQTFLQGSWWAIFWSDITACDTEPTVMTLTTLLLHTSTIHHPPTPSLLEMQAEGVFLLSPPFSASGGSLLTTTTPQPCHQPPCCANHKQRGFSCQHHSSNCTGMKQRRTVGTKGVPTFFSFSFCLLMQGGSQGDLFSPGVFDANMKGSVGYHNDGQAYKVCLQFLSVSLYLTNPHYDTETPPPFWEISSAYQHPPLFEMQGGLESWSPPPSAYQHPSCLKCEWSGFSGHHLSACQHPSSLEMWAEQAYHLSLLANTLLTHISMPGWGLTPLPLCSSPTRCQKVCSLPFWHHDA